MWVSHIKTGLFDSPAEFPGKDSSYGYMAMATGKTIEIVLAFFNCSSEGAGFFSSLFLSLKYKLNVDDDIKQMFVSWQKSFLDSNKLAHI